MTIEYIIKAIHKIKRPVYIYKRSDNKVYLKPPNPSRD